MGKTIFYGKKFRKRVDKFLNGEYATKGMTKEDITDVIANSLTGFNVGIDANDKTLTLYNTEDEPISISLLYCMGAIEYKDIVSSTVCNVASDEELDTLLDVLSSNFLEFLALKLGGKYA